MIYITGDTHIPTDIGKLGSKRFHQQKNLTKNDYVIICGNFGGASSRDKEYRTEGKNWWKEELPSVNEIEHARKKLESVNYTVDYIITHCAADRVQSKVADYEENILTSFFEELAEKTNYKKWFFRHYHIDKEIDDRHVAVFDRVIKLG